MAEQNEVVTGPYNYVMQSMIAKKESFMKPLRMLEMWMEVPKADTAKVLEIVESFFYSGIMLDDIQDGNESRSGKPTPYCLYGVPMTLSSVLWGMNNTFKKIINLNEPKAVPLFVEALRKTLLGQGMAMYWNDNSICPTKKEYVTTIVSKVNAPVMFATQMIQLYGEDNTVDFVTVIESMGTSMQIATDLLQLRADKIEQKGYCEDIAMGKFSFPIIHAIQSHPEDTRIIEILKQKTTDAELQKECLALIEKYGGSDFSNRYLEKLKKKALVELKKIGAEKYLEKSFKEMKEKGKGMINL